MNANEREWFDGTVRRVVGAAFEVSNCLGSGFLEKVYERALMIELQDRGLKAASQVKLPFSTKANQLGIM